MSKITRDTLDQVKEQALTTSNQIHALPDSGYLVGQSLSSAFMAALKIGHGPINDIYIFHPSDQPVNGPTVHGQSALAIAPQDGYNEVFVFHGHVGTPAYKIADSQRQDRLNTVQVKLLDDFTDTTAAIIGSFDINCCEVGINLATRELAVTREFLHFLNSKQLEITNLNTPLHTAIRILQKHQQIEGSYLDTDHQMQLAYIGSKHLPYKQYFREGYRDKYEEVREVIAPYFKLKQEGHRFQGARQETDVWTLTPENRLRDFENTPLYSRFMLKEQVAGKAIVNEYNLLTKTHSKKRQAKIDSVEQYPIIHGKLLAHGPEFLKGNMADKHLDMTNKLLEDHPLLIERMTQMNTFEQLYEAALSIRYLEKHYGQYTIGVLESNARPITTRENMVKEIDTYLAKGRENIIEPIIKEFSAGDYTITELTSRTELLMEGEAMDHCVGGYAQAIDFNRRIFAMRHAQDPNKHSTVEAVFTADHPPDLFVIQHFGKSNTPPDKENIRVFDQQFKERLVERYQEIQREQQTLYERELEEYERER